MGEVRHDFITHQYPKHDISSNNPLNLFNILKKKGLKLCKGRKLFRRILGGAKLLLLCLLTTWKIEISVGYWHLQPFFFAILEFFGFFVCHSDVTIILYKNVLVCHIWIHFSDVWTIPLLPCLVLLRQNQIIFTLYGFWPHN